MKRTWFDRVLDVLERVEKRLTRIRMLDRFMVKARPVPAAFHVPGCSCNECLGQKRGNGTAPAEGEPEWRGLDEHDHPHNRPGE